MTLDVLHISTDINIAGVSHLSLPQENSNAEHNFNSCIKYNCGIFFFSVTKISIQVIALERTSAVGRSAPNIPQKFV